VFPLFRVESLRTIIHTINRLFNTIHISVNGLARRVLSKPSGTISRAASVSVPKAVLRAPSIIEIKVYCGLAVKNAVTTTWDTRTMRWKKKGPSLPQTTPFLAGSKLHWASCKPRPVGHTGLARHVRSRRHHHQEAPTATLKQEIRERLGLIQYNTLLLHAGVEPRPLLTSYPHRIIWSFRTACSRAVPCQMLCRPDKLGMYLDRKRRKCERGMQ
jgi:hypothetical protein